MKPSTNTTTLLSLILVTVFALTPAGPTMAEESLATNFRVDSGVFQLPETEPYSRSVTLFVDGVVYDFMLDSKQITIFDDVKDVFTLIDAKRGIQTVIPMQFIDKAIKRLTTRAVSSSDPQTQFLYNPKFEPTQKDTATGELIFKSPWITYRVDAKQGNIKAAKQYHRFANAYAKLNTILHPGSRPPFARMLVNKTLNEGTMLPHAVQVTYGKENKTSRFRSKHRYDMKQLNEDAKKRVKTAKESREVLKVVTLEEYQKS